MGGVLCAAFGVDDCEKKQMSIDKNQELRCVISDLMDQNKSLRTQLAQQADMVEKCMVAMNANADEAKRLDGVIAALTTIEEPAHIDAGPAVRLTHPAPSKPEPLTRSEIINLAYEYTALGEVMTDDSLCEFTHAVEAAVWEKCK